jgi:hypothetical protein
MHSFAPSPDPETDVLRQRLTAARARMRSHPVFAAVRDLDDLRGFMAWHVFAVWDFMSLVKRLQRLYTGTALPWRPPANPRAARLINEIVLGEESDLGFDGGHVSHYELYLQAMTDVGADTAPVRRFLDALSSDLPAAEALRRAGAPAPVQAFVASTLATALHGRPEEVLGSFLHGREDAIPAMFSRLLTDWGLSEAQAPAFVYYLRRHIELDGDSHGPAAQALAQDAVRHDPAAERRLLFAGLAAIGQRIALWDGLQQHLQDARARPSTTAVTL